MHFHHRFREGFGVGYEGVDCAFRLIFVLELACLCVGIDGEEGASGGDGGYEGAGSALIPFEVAAAVVVVGLRESICDSVDFHDFGGEDILVSGESSVVPTRIPSGVVGPVQITNGIGYCIGIDDDISFKSSCVCGVRGGGIDRILDSGI